MKSVILKGIGFAILFSGILFSSCTTSKYPEKFGLALYTVRDAMNEDAEAALDKVAEIGYTYLEVASYNLDDGSFYKMTPQEFKDLAEQKNLQVVSSHTGVERVMNEDGSFNSEKAEKLIGDHSILGVKYIVNAGISNKYRGSAASYKLIADAINQLGKMAAEKNMSVLYHNHAFEFDSIDGTRGYDILLNELNPEFANFQMDCYWVVRAGIDPYQMIVENEGRFKEIHLKDMDNTEEKFFAEVGHGVINYSDILENGKKLGVEYFLVEQDRSRRDPMESAKMSYDYLSSLNEMNNE